MVIVNWILFFLLVPLVLLAIFNFPAAVIYFAVIFFAVCVFIYFIAHNLDTEDAHLIRKFMIFNLCAEAAIVIYSLIKAFWLKF